MIELLISCGHSKDDLLCYPSKYSLPLLMKFYDCAMRRKTKDEIRLSEWADAMRIAYHAKGPAYNRFTQELRRHGR